MEISSAKINTNASLLCRDPETIEEHYRNLRGLGIAPEKISSNPPLLSLSPETVQDYYDNLRKLGISPKIINVYAHLLAFSPKTIQKHCHNLRSLGIEPKKIVKCADLLARNPVTIQDHYDNLISLGIDSIKIVDRVELLYRNPEVLNNNFYYLTDIIGIEDWRIQMRPQLLSENPDAFVKKMRILKLDILGLKRKNKFNPNEYYRVFIASPATLTAKKIYCIEHNIDYNLSLLSRSWKCKIEKVDPFISEDDANKKGMKIRQLFKQKYDIWMTENKKWSKKFAERRGRRLIIKL